MGQVIQLRRNAVRSKVTKTAKCGGTYGLIEMRMTDEGSLFSVEGVYADRLQFAGYTLIKALNEIADRISTSGTAGSTPSETIQVDMTQPTPKPVKIYPWPNPEKGCSK